MDEVEPVIPPFKAMQAASEGFKEGKYPGMSWDDYEAAPGVSNTMLGDWVRGKKKSKTRAMLVGSALHDRMLGRKHFDDCYELIRDVNLTTAEGKKVRDEAEAATGKVALRQAEMLHVAAMFKAIAGHPMGRKYIESKAEREVAIFSRIGSEGSSTLPKHPTLMKGVIDLLDAGVIDLKTTGYRTQAEFKNSIVKFNYDAQAALYRELAASACNGEYRRFFWLCVAKEPPHDVWAEEANPYMLASGLKWTHTVLKLYERESDV